MPCLRSLVMARARIRKYEYLSRAFSTLNFELLDSTAKCNSEF